MHSALALDFEFAFETVDDDVEVKLSHTGDNGLAGFFVGLNLEGWVFFGELLQTHAEFVEVFLSEGFDCDTDYGIGEVHGL